MSQIPVLVTGATGYLGVRVLQALCKTGIQAAGITGKTGGALPCDLTDSEAVHDLLDRVGAETVIHCAAKVPKKDADYADEKAAYQSVTMVDNLISARPAHIVFTSTMTVYRPGTPLPVREEDAISELTGYSAGKKAAEEKLLHASGLKATILRLPGLFGPPRRAGLLYNAAVAFAKGRKPPIPNNPPLWAAMHVDDAADLCLRAALRESSSSIVLNAGYLGRMSISSALAELASLFGAHAPVCMEAPDFEMDLTRLESEIGLPRYDLHTRLRELADWAICDAMM